MAHAFWYAELPPAPTEAVLKRLGAWDDSLDVWAQPMSTQAFANIASHTLQRALQGVEVGAGRHLSALEISKVDIAWRLTRKWVGRGDGSLFDVTAQPKSDTEEAAATAARAAVEALVLPL